MNPCISSGLGVTTKSKSFNASHAVIKSENNDKAKNILNVLNFMINSYLYRLNRVQKYEQLLKYIQICFF